MKKITEFVLLIGQIGLLLGTLLLIAVPVVTPLLMVAALFKYLIQ